MKKYLSNIFAGVLCASLTVVSGCGGGGGSTSVTPPSTGVTNPIASTLTKSNLPHMHAVHMEGNWGGNIQGISNLPDSYIQRLKANNIDYVAITLPIFMVSISDPTVQIRYRPSGSTNYDATYSFNDTDLSNAITKLKQNGINVYLSIALLQSQTGAQAGTCNSANYEVDPHLLGDPQIPNASNSSGFEYQCVNPSLWWWNPSDARYATNISTFWSTYTQVVVHYAQMAQQLGVGMIGVGEETDRLFTTRSSTRFPTNYKIQLSNMVTAVRAVYSGLVTYGQNGIVYSSHPEWWGFDYMASGYLFKDLGLDVVGLSYYFSIAPSTVASVMSVAQLESLWNSNFQSVLSLVQANNSNIPIIFSSVGFSDAVNIPFQPLDSAGAAYAISDLNNNGIDDGMEQQSNMYQSLFNVNKNNNYPVAGFFCFGYVIDSDPNIFSANQSTRNSELHNRPAEQIIKNTYSTF
jgi:hypothetical protein